MIFAKFQGLKNSYKTKPNFKSWNFEKILLDSYSLNNFWLGSFGFPEFQYLSKIFSLWFRTYSLRSGMDSYHSGMDSYCSGMNSFQCSFSHSAYCLLWRYEVFRLYPGYPWVTSYLATFPWPRMALKTFLCVLMR